MASIAKSIHVEDLLSPSIIPSVVTFSSATPIQLERGDNRHSNPTTAYGTPNSARNTWIDVCDTWSVNDNDNKETNRSPIQELAYPEVGSFGDSTMSKTVSPVRQVLTSSSYLSPMFESAILEDPSLTPVFVDRY